MEGSCFMAHPSESELQDIAELRSMLPQLQDEPPHICSDVNMLRNLRGFGSVDAAASKLQSMLSWRRESAELLEGVIANTPADMYQGDTSALPYAEQLNSIIPLKMLAGSSRDGLPMNCLYVSQLDLNLFSAISEEQFEAFIITFMEQRGIVLHNLSERQGQGVQYAEMRDVDLLAITDLLSSPRILKRLKSVFAKIQTYYPETTKSIHIVHPPSTYSALFKVISTFMNQRQVDKITVAEAGNCIPMLATVMTHESLFSWVRIRGNQAGALNLAKGQTRYLAERVEEGQNRVRVRASMVSGGDFPACLEFMGAGPEGLYQTLWSGMVGQFEQEFEVGPGVAVFVMDNSAAWFGGVDLNVEMTTC
eukprot:TRINITY_DN10431_c0_g1_i1.p1 TRINITY_DN10431_c0_g1~~TRINITY_DN10431_c0_g1_i1.p1  ORF type:complete len:364 (-),score=96.30 TRINITY_DN10431_c0_g1_i1:153-1244(-)